MTPTNELERLNARNSHIWPEGGVTSGRARMGRLFYKMITAWVILCMVVWGCGVGYSISFLVSTSGNHSFILPSACFLISGVMLAVTLT